MMKKNYDVIIVGGGAAGLVAAVVLGKENPRLRVALMDKNPQLGKKLMATGNGRCNLSHVSCENSSQILAFFREIGVATYNDSQGRIYPKSEQANDVVQALVQGIGKNSIDVFLNHTVKKVSPMEKGFLIDGAFFCEKLLIATGGKAAPHFGTTGDGYPWAKAFGHHIETLFPVLTPMKAVTGDLKGVRTKAEITLCREKKGEQKVLYREKGEVQFVEGGLSGICIFNASRFLKLDGNTSFSHYKLLVDFCPEYSREELEKELTFREGKGLSLIRSLVPEKVGQWLLTESDTKEDLIGQLKEKKITIKGAKGWRQAQCTKGGISLKEVYEETMESKLQKGLYFAGEILDFDGFCGGFNLQFAWESGYKAGRSMAGVSNPRD